MRTRHGLIAFPLFLCVSGALHAQDTHSQSAPQWPILAAICCVVGGTILTNIYLVGLLHSIRIRVSRHWTRIWEFSPPEVGGTYWKQLILCSFLSLFFELLMIRWISSEITIFAYFKNFVLIACFLGFGLGCYLSHLRINLLHIIVPLLGLTLLVRLPLQILRDVMSAIPTLVGGSSEVHIWGVPTQFSLPMLAIALAIIVPIFSLICFAFIPLGQLVGFYLENSRDGILAYSVNVLASLAGILFYTLLSFLWQPPAVWFFVAGSLLVWFVWKQPSLRWGTAIVFLVCMALLTIRPTDSSTTYWSPYQKLTIVPAQVAGKTVAYQLWTNDSWYQQILDLSPKFVAAHPEAFEKAPIEWNAYNLPYHFYPHPPSTLILGSGMGNDVAAALRNGSEHVTAVEIDPLILHLGETLHFEQPYSSPQVQRVQDDARSYIQKTHDRFDLIVFSLLDSHTTSSHFTNIRIDNYVYTLEALKAARNLLRPDGIFVVKFDVETPWIAGRLYGLLTKVFGRPPLQLEPDRSFTTTGGRFFIVGSEARMKAALSDPQLSAYVTKHGLVNMSPATLTTDDWPYFYQHEPGIPVSVIAISVALIILCWVLLRDAGISIGAFRWHFFFLGAGFLLLEAQIISRVALLFGTTWVVNSIIIAGLLLLIVAANAVVKLKPTFPAGVAYIGVFISLAASYWVPLQKFLVSSFWIKISASIFFLCLPVFFAGVIFIRSFATAGFRVEALGSNLFGAMVGGILESASMLTGIRSLVIIAGLLYAASWIALRLEDKLTQMASPQTREALATGVPL